VDAGREVEEDEVEMEMIATAGRLKERRDEQSAQELEGWMKLRVGRPPPHLQAPYLERGPWKVSPVVFGSVKQLVSPRR
jgi:hypothetical protein